MDRGILGLESLPCGSAEAAPMFSLIASQIGLCYLTRGGTAVSSPEAFLR